MLDVKRLTQLLSRNALPTNTLEEQFIIGYDLALNEVLLKDCILVSIDSLTHEEYIYLTVGYSMGQASVAAAEDENFIVDDIDENIH